MLRLLFWAARSVFALTRRPSCTTLVLLVALPLTAYVAWKAGGGGGPAPAAVPVSTVVYQAGGPAVHYVSKNGDRVVQVVRIPGPRAGTVFFSVDGQRTRAFEVPPLPEKRSG
ncbi:hypothetical protein ABGB17_28595 [Sphaerisporangium sp. B11E5]|uniref:hypothetical protein n=1 Tax=Sphaerisporangium sp. B11E5 TaxID=3153563 RepID=UPI00325CEDCE